MYACGAPSSLVQMKIFAFKFQTFIASSFSLAFLQLLWFHCHVIFVRMPY